MAFWMYNEDGGKLFQDGEKVPAGYVDSPDKVGKEAPKKKKASKNDNG
tara:strand:- start:610 stop:753 length:144 start_codon:yes stop_codon:yes gene_type:complete